MTEITDPEKLTDPEWRAARAQAEARLPAVVAKVVACGGCYCCTNRDRRTEGWDLALCGLKPAAEFRKRGCRFDPDMARIAPLLHQG